MDTTKYTIYSEAQEHDDPRLRNLHSNIIHVEINGLITFTFIPFWDIEGRPWPPVLPDDVDIVATENEAKYFQAGLAEILITTEQGFQGPPLFQLNFTKEDYFDCLFVKVSEATFNSLWLELKEGAANYTGINQKLPISNLKGTTLKNVIQSILEFIDKDPETNGTGYLLAKAKKLGIIT